jgi:hypothetical protein
MDTENQVSNFLDKRDMLPQFSEADSPRVPFPSALRLNREQEDALVQRAMKRVRQLEDELGRETAGNREWFKDIGKMAGDMSRSFMGKRELYELVYQNRVEWRRFILGGIFSDSNLVVPLTRRICRQMVARANNYFFSTDPWFEARPEGAEDSALAEDLERYAKHKFAEAKVKDALEVAIEMSFVRGEQVVKTTHKHDEDIFKTIRNVLVSGKGGNPIMTEAGEYVFDFDSWIPSEEEEGIFVLGKDATIKYQEGLVYESRLVMSRKVNYSGPEAGLVHYKDFLCPLNAKSIDEADTVVHIYDKSVMEIADQYRRRELDAAPDESIEATQKAIQMIRDLAGNSNQWKSGEKSGKDNLGEEENHENTNDPIVEICEVYMRFDADGDGILEDVMLIADKQTQTPIFYDYVGNVTPDGKRPFVVIRPNRVDGRWYGIGAIEMFETTQEIVDLLVNRWNFSQSRAGRIDFWNPHLTEEGDANPNLELNWGETYTLKAGSKPEDVIHSHYLNDIKHEQIQNMFEFFLQMAMNESGVQHANDANMVGLDQAKLATGIRNIEKSGMEMFSIYIAALESGVRDVVQKLSQVMLTGLNDVEAFEYFNGVETELVEIRPERIADLSMDCKILLSKYKGEQTMAQSMQGVQVIQQFYSQPYEIQVVTAKFYRMMIKALDMNIDADEVIQPVGAVSGQAPGQPALNPQQAIEAVTPKPSGMPTPNL